MRLRLLLLLLPGLVVFFQPLCPLTAEEPALLAQHADIGPAQEGVAEGKDRHQESKGAAHGHEDDGVGRDGHLIPDVGGEVARVGELEEADDAQEAVLEPRLLGRCEVGPATFDDGERVDGSAEPMVAV